MLIAKVVGNVVATQKDEGLVGTKLLIICPLYEEFRKEKCVVAVDSVGAGIGETVLVVKGSSARLTDHLKSSPIDHAIIGIIDEIELDESSF
ncbi:Ethanolamine utilization protein EutN/carboxysome structural protein Ccml, putative [Halanaerobium saccharolyticum subsp. saccharolyticum DSM 6643]|jgi:ethanolamine utilization protein EutN|uniref:Ethanolamine utilization protein EutN/carboxysome structural protein Ccml, putative n=1 Tax=Halanaerobium saccharolyticum subsp. saccharolyticum DSM 6643 TaxID=1293054 RepID=M5DY78_9FIRM|nr:EutN/CcmL family microcompartment protein [Halanaerobium saccharolyticum]CCU77908.1 Ethanolamine utilization protein EutN/carboxysome structural protein Ccml, putative [Halanaerobium saccharolyticum subsp. saccharolyticum DSM 6643]